MKQMRNHLDKDNTYTNRVVCEREVITLVNRALKKAPTLAGLTEKTINKWRYDCGSQCNYDVRNIYYELISISSLLGSMSDNSRTVFEVRDQGSARGLKKHINDLNGLLKDVECRVETDQLPQLYVKAKSEQGGVGSRRSVEAAAYPCRPTADDGRKTCP